MREERRMREEWRELNEVRGEEREEWSKRGREWRMKEEEKDKWGQSRGWGKNVRRK